MGISVLGSARNGEMGARKGKKWGNLGVKTAKLDNCWFKRAKMGNGGLNLGNGKGKNTQMWVRNGKKTGSLGLKRAQMGNFGFRRAKNGEFWVPKGQK